MCVPRVPATFLQIFIPGVKCSWSLPPCLFSCSFSRLTLTLTFFNPDWDWQEGGDISRGWGGRKRASECSRRSEAKEKKESRERKPLVQCEWGAVGAAVREWWAEDRACSVMDDLSCYRNQKAQSSEPSYSKNTHCSHAMSLVGLIVE